MFSQPLTEAIAEAERLVAAAPFIESEADLLEGLQYLAGCVAGCTHLAFDYERDHPLMQSGTGPFTKMGLDNPDTLYFGTRVQAGHEYVVTGKRGSTTDLSFQMLGGEYTDDNVPVSQAAFDDRELDIGPDGSFEWRITPDIPSQLLVREVYNDWSAQRGHISIARTDTAGTAPPPLTKELIEKRYAVAGKQLVQRVKTWLQFPQWFYNTLPVNTMVAPRLTPGGLATQYSSVGHFDLTPDEALLITLPVTDVPYLGFQLGSLWYISLDYINHQTSLNGTQAQADPDGKIRIVVSDANPGVANWVETLGHCKGYLQFRWQRLSRELTEADGPTVELLDIDKVADALLYYESNKVSEEGMACADRAASEANWRQNGCVMLLKDKVVVISGVGPALGTTLARRCADAGADLVLAARTVERLDDVAKQITDLGRRAVSVGTDITDEAQVDNLVEESLKAYGRIDVLINNAFRVPSMKPLANTTFDHMRDAIELTVFGALRLIQGFTPALAESKGSVVNVNSMVVRHSQAKYGAYKMAKSALLAMSQSLATELGEQGIRVNSIVPGYIWGGTLEGYFGHQAKKYGTTVDEIYKATAAASDLKRLPTEDEVASAILFMSSDLSSGITGQALDVNCGEYKA